MTNVFATPHRDNGSAGEADHEQVAFCQDTKTGLRAIIAIYSTALGPALGGTRFFPYPTEDAALRAAAESTPLQLDSVRRFALPASGGQRTVAVFRRA